jgi:hypothetical protein
MGVKSKMKRYRKFRTSIIQGKPREKVNNALKEGIDHPKIGRLSWELDDGTVVVCRSYYEYKLNK